MTGVSFYHGEMVDNLNNNLTIFSYVSKWFDSYFDRIAPDFIPKVKIDGTSFQKRVYQEVLKIKYGDVKTYFDIAKSLGENISCQAIGQALKRNPILIIIPCHRIIKKDGTLGGYVGGEYLKKTLLKNEKIL